MGMSSEAMHIIDEYLAKVRRYLPKDIGDDVVEELRVNILDRIEDMGGLTVENAYYVINDLGPPRRLASRYVVGRGRKRLTLELGISEDLYPYFVYTALIIFIVMVMAYTFRILDYVFSTGSVSGFRISVMVVEMIASLTLSIFLLYLSFSFISSNPDIVGALKEAISSIFEHREKEYKKPKETIKPKIRARPRKIGDRASPWPYIVTSIFAYIFAYMIYIYGTGLPFNWLMTVLIYTMVLALLFSGSISFIYFFYVLYHEARNYVLDTIKSLTPLSFIPWLLLANIFTEDIQILMINTEVIENGGSILEAMSIIALPSEYIILAKLLTVLLLIAIVAGCIVVILKYVRTIPRKKEPEK